MNNKNLIFSEVKQRIYAPLTKYLAIETDYVLVGGEKGPQKLTADPKLWRIAELDKVNGVLDMDMAHNSSAEIGDIELTLKIKQIEGDVAGEFTPAASEVLVYLGLNELSIPVAPLHKTIDYKDLVVGGTYGAETLDVIADLAKNGSSLTLTYIHASSDETKAFTHKPTHKQFNHDGTSAGDKRYPFPRAGRMDENTSIREIDNVAIVLDGFSGLELSVLDGAPLELQIDTIFKK